MDSPFPPAVAFVTANSRADLIEESWVLAEAGQASAKRREEYALGRACARQALRRIGAWQNGPAPQLPQATPQLPQAAPPAGRTPLWPAGLVGSITHSRGRAAAAVAWRHDMRGLGVDLEQLRELSGAMLGRILRPEERRVLEQQPEAVRPALAVIAFSAKESVYKALNPLTGVYLGFQDVRLTVQLDLQPPASYALPARGTLHWTLLKDCGPGYPAGTTGVGAYRVAAPWVLTGVWLPAA